MTQTTQFCSKLFFNNAGKGLIVQKPEIEDNMSFLFIIKGGIR